MSRRLPGGSSPLARGLRLRGAAEGGDQRIIPARAGFTRRSVARVVQLPDHPRSRGVYGASGLDLHAGLRIIPARAGFTCASAAGRSPTGDHPRSRGVYGGITFPVPCSLGSSPLARGLHVLRSVTSGGSGIIPARAGFTGQSRAPARILRDHPRSRGVYSRSAGSGRPMPGSSPLARGLPRQRHRAVVDDGIIPARAGFTRSASPSALAAPDHPRSRGVYTSNGTSIITSFGSSPLARGLLLEPADLELGGRIIPARAGFTTAPGSRRARCGDHPRSRGVYAAGGLVRSDVRGSSPLARGLQPTCGGRLPGYRIIPARAGFTRGRLVPAVSCSDHPRSRGVYRVRQVMDAPLCGSSPLARGLQPVRGVRGLVRGIIPARAGFTSNPVGRPAERWDHPRSRGVYSVIRSDDPDYEGSSPLARGLLAVFLGNRHAIRIIPARAGFTAAGRITSWATRDHPRSRGVYRGIFAPPVTMSGSSPLARGLPPIMDPDLIGVGIIPARAGFTWSCTPASPHAADHPRSRGVYRTATHAVASSDGSSPLARGLRGRGAQAAAARGIIPARAGFTTGGMQLSRPARDHPRSRGVYLPR